MQTALTSEEQSLVYSEDFDQQTPSSWQSVDPRCVGAPALSLFLCGTIGFLHLSELVHASHVRLRQRQIPKIHAERRVTFPDDGSSVREQDSPPYAGLNFGCNVRNSRVECIRNPRCIGICRELLRMAFLEGLERLWSEDFLRGKVKCRPSGYNDCEYQSGKKQYWLKRQKNL